MVLKMSKTNKTKGWIGKMFKGNPAHYVIRTYCRDGIKKVLKRVTNKKHRNQEERIINDSRKE